MTKSAGKPAAAEKPRIPYGIAKAAADELVERFGRYVQRIEIAGSIRRKRRDVKDIELVLIPKLSASPQLFEVENQPLDRNLFREELDRMLVQGLVHPRLKEDGSREAWGPRHQRFYYHPQRPIAGTEDLIPAEGIPVDVFGVLPPAQWGVIFFLRTGPVGYTKPIITPSCEGGRILKIGMKVEHGALWDRGRVVETPEEKDFYDAIGLRYADPEVRWK